MCVYGYQCRVDWQPLWLWCDTFALSRLHVATRQKNQHTAERDVFRVRGPCETKTASCIRAQWCLVRRRVAMPRARAITQRKFAIACVTRVNVDISSGRILSTKTPNRLLFSLCFVCLLAVCVARTTYFYFKKLPLRLHNEVWPKNEKVGTENVIFVCVFVLIHFSLAAV